MPTEIFRFAAVFLAAYAAFLTAYFLAGRDRVKSLYAALAPSVAALLVYLLSETAFVYAAVALTAAVGFLAVFFISEKNPFLSAATLFVALSFCMSMQLAAAFFDPGDTAALISAALCLVFPLLTALFGAVIFPSGYILTKQQKKSVFSRQFFFFPGLCLLLILQILLLCGAVELSVYSLAFALIFHIFVLVLLKMQVKSFKERIESLIDKQYQAELLNFMRIIRSQRHDFNFHMQTIYGMIESGRYDECRDYVNSMMKTVRSTNELLPLASPAASALLNTFSEMAMQKGLRLEIEIHDNLQFISTSVYETNTILGNLLQNAVDELELHPENKCRVINLLIIKRGKYNIIKVSNECHLPPDEMSRVFTPGFTTKKSHEGLGLASALRTAEKYDGTVYPEFEGKNVSFIAKIPMKR